MHGPPSRIWRTRGTRANSLITYLVGVVVLAAMTVPPAWAAVVVRRRLLPGWSGPQALLVEALVWTAQMLTVPTLLGAVGLFRRWPVVLGLVVVAVVLTRLTPLSLSSSSPPAHVPASRFAHRAGAAICALLVGPWLVTMVQSWRFGTTSYDTLGYHLSFPARWFQTGSTWHIQQITPGLIVPYHPASAEIFNGLGMLAFHSDLISPLLNVLWLGLLGLAAWCLGAPRGRAPHCLALALVVASCPMMVSTQAGSGMNDLALVAVVVAAVALLVQGVSFRDVAVPLGAALGLSVGIKLDALAPVAVIFIGALVLSAARDRLAVAVRTLVPALVIGGFWYVRDLVAVGNPIPGLNVGLFPEVKAPLDQVGGFSVLHYATNVHVIHRFFMAGLRIDFGALWPLWLLVSGVGAVAVLIWSPSPVYRLAAVVAVVSVVAYLVTPTSAFGLAGKPTLFVYNVRYAMVGLVLGAALVPVVPRAASETAGRALLAVTGVLGLATLWARQSWPIPPDISIAWRPLGLGVSAVAVAAVLLATLAPRTALLAVGALAAVVGLVFGAFVQTRWIKREYQHVARLSPALAWGRTVHHARIAYTGLAINYPLAGTDDSNYTEFVGVTGPHHEYKVVPDCRTLRTELRTGRFGYVVFSQDYSTGHVPAADAWVRGAPGAVPVLDTPAASVYRLTSPLDPSTCGAA